MSRRLRFIPEGGALVEVTCRTQHGRFLLRPGAALNEIVLGILGRAQKTWQVKVCAFAFLSNHYHLLVWVKDAQQLGGLMNLFNSKLAREVGRLTGWREKIWSRRYQSIVVSSEEAAQVERLRYVLAHGSRRGWSSGFRSGRGSMPPKRFWRELPWRALGSTGPRSARPGGGGRTSTG